MACNITFWSCDTISTSTAIVWCKQHHQCHHCIHNDWNEVQNDFLVMWSHWHYHWHHSIVNGTNEILMSRWSKGCATWLLGHVMPLGMALASHDTNSFTNSTTEFLRSRQWMICNMIILVMWCHWHQNQCHMIELALVSESYDSWGIINGTSAVLRTQWLKWDTQHHLLIMWKH